MKDWSRIEQEAREQVTRELQAAETVPLVVGQVIAWSECCCSRTSGISPIHRIGDVKNARTYCGELIPGVVRRFPLNPRLEWSMPRCKYCAIAYSQFGTREASA